MYSQLHMPEFALAAPVKIPELDHDKHYRLEVLANSSSDIYMKQPPLWMREKTTMSGALLQQVGLMMPVMQPESALLLKFSAQ